MTARGKREARRPWFTKEHGIKAWKADIYTQFRPFRARTALSSGIRGDALPACPGCPYLRLWRSNPSSHSPVSQQSPPL